MFYTWNDQNAKLIQLDMNMNMNIWYEYDLIWYGYEYDMIMIWYEYDIWFDLILGNNCIGKGILFIGNGNDMTMYWIIIWLFYDIYIMIFILRQVEETLSIEYLISNFSDIKVLRVKVEVNVRLNHINMSCDFYYKIINKSKKVFSYKEDCIFKSTFLL